MDDTFWGDEEELMYLRRIPGEKWEWLEGIRHSFTIGRSFRRARGIKVSEASKVSASLDGICCLILENMLRYV